MLCLKQYYKNTSFTMHSTKNIQKHYRYCVFKLQMQKIQKNVKNVLFASIMNKLRLF